MEIKENNDEGFTLAEALKEYPELKKDPMYNEYGFAGESIFEMIAKKLNDKIGLIAERNNRENKFAVDFKIINPKTNEVICYCDMEGNGTEAFEELDGTFRWFDLSVPLEKKKYFFRDKPFFYIKYSGDFKWCYVIDGWASRDLFEEQPRIRKGILRKLWIAKSCAIFNRKMPYGIHRCPVQDWLKGVAYFMNKRYSQLKLDDFK
ncbi:MAG TPA: hypothetical protein VMZ91_06880 [Candidatus Paceibacterota bacterium]|nr:hypothetical protein [Candidatus Paceibacterota bacterium]